MKTLDGPESGDSYQTVVSPAGTVYQSWFDVPTIPLTGRLGDTSQPSDYISAVRADGSVAFVLKIGGVIRIDAIATDAAGNLYFAGAASATGLPVTPGAYRPTSAGGSADYLCKLRIDGSLAFCTYLDPDPVVIFGITVDSAGAIYIAGSDLATSVATTSGALAETGGSIVIRKMTPSGSALVFGAALNVPVSFREPIAVDGAGNVYLAASGTLSNDPSDRNGSLLRVLKADGSALLYSAFLNPGEIPDSMALDQAANVYLTGHESNGAMFVRKYSGFGPNVAYEKTFPIWPNVSYPVGPWIIPVAIAVDETGAASVAGYTSAVNFPTYHSQVPCSTTAVPPADAGFLMRFSPAGDLLQSSYLPEDSDPVALAVTPSAAYIAGAALAPGSGGEYTAHEVFLTFGPQAAATDTALACVGNAASFALAGLSAGEVVSLFGSGLGPQQGVSWQLDANRRLSTTLGSTQVTFDGVPAPLLWVQDAQINAITPWALANRTTTHVCVTAGAIQTNCIDVPVVPAAPGVFMTANGLAAAVNQDGTINSPSNPAAIGSIVSVYATGTGPITPAPVDGSATQFPLPVSNYPLLVLVPSGVPPDRQVSVSYAGPAPYEPTGITQVNFTVNSTAWYLQVRLPDGSARNSQVFNIAVK